MQQVVHLAADGAHLDLRIDQAGGPDDLLDHHAGRFGQLVGPGRGGNIDAPGARDSRTPQKSADGCRSALGRRKPYSTSISLARAVAVIHALQLRNGLMAFVDEHQRDRAADNRAAWAALRPAGGRRNGANNSRCRGSSRSGGSFPDRTWCAGTGAAPQSACLAFRAPSATTPARSRCSAARCSRVSGVIT